MSYYQHLSIDERESLLRKLGEGKTIRTIAKELSRSPSTISREIRRNSKNKETYSAVKAERKYRQRRKKSCRSRILKGEQAKRLIRYLIEEQQWSPEQIANRLRLEENEIQVSYSTIYRSIYLGDLETEKLSHGNRGIIRKLRHKGKTRHKKGYQETRGKIRISHPIEERPTEANNRTEIGHWEADTVAGRTGYSCMITLADRKSRFLLGERVSRKTAAEVEHGMIAMLLTLPPDKRKTITPDRGKEFTTHANVTAALSGLPFYFPRPHAPWQRGTNENTNGLIREYFPRNSFLENLDDTFFHDFIDKLNHRPRKCLGWRSPFEIFFDTVLRLT